jgi:hypothetical protein
MIIVGQIKPLWGWLQRQRAQGWPTAPGKINQARVEAKSASFFSTISRRDTSGYNAQISYSYVMGGDTYEGSWKKEFGDESEALEFVRGLFGQPVMVSYNPGRASDSTLQEAAIKKLQEARPASPLSAGARAHERDVPAWVKPLLWPFVMLSAVGLGLSLWVHFGAVAGRKVAPESFFWMLHVGIFVVWFPAVFVANRRVGNQNRKDFWNAVFRGSPPWFKYTVYAFLGYAVVNFLLFFSQAPRETNPSGETPVIVWRGFSGHWMAFYSAALAILYSAVRSPSDSSINPWPSSRRR